MAPDAKEFIFQVLGEGNIADYVEAAEGKRCQCKRARLAEKSIKHHLNNAQGIFAQVAKDYPDFLARSPFADLRIVPKPPRGGWRYVSYEATMKAIEACTDTYTSRVGWQVFIALQRFSGLRKGEALDLRKQDVDVASEPMVIKVYCSKTARSSGKPSRVVPILYPALKLLLLKAIGESDPADLFVVSSRLPRQKGSDHKTLTRILKRAGLERWRPGFQVLRACAEIDFLDLGLSEYRYTRAIGHSPEVSRRHYLGRFDDVVLDERERDEFQAAAARLQERLSEDGCVPSSSERRRNATGASTGLKATMGFSASERWF